MKRIFSIIMVLTFIWSLPLAAFADESDKTVIIQRNQVIHGDFFRMGDNIKNLGTVKGDIFAASGNFQNDGYVTGDIILGSGNGIIGGSVDGDIRVGAGNILINGKVGKNVTAFAGELKLDENGVVDGSITGYAGNVTIDGTVGGDLRCGAGRVVINGQINGDLTLETDQLTFGPNGKVLGNLYYVSEKEFYIPGGAVAGEIEHKLQKAPINGEGTKKIEKGFKVFNVVGKAVSMLSYLIIGGFLVFVFRDFFKGTALIIDKRPWHSLGIGFVGLIVIPIASILVMITVIGIPVGIISLLLYGILLYLAKLPGALWIGNKVVKNEENPMLPMAVGILILLLIGYIPYLGGFVSLLALLFGIGSYLQNIKYYIGKPKKVDPFDE